MVVCLSFAPASPVQFGHDVAHSFPFVRQRQVILSPSRPRPRRRHLLVKAHLSVRVPTVTVWSPPHRCLAVEVVVDDPQPTLVADEKPRPFQKGKCFSDLELPDAILPLLVVLVHPVADVMLPK